MAFYCKQLLNGGLDLLKWIKGQSFKRQALNSHAHLCYWKETLTCWAVALAGTGWLDTLFQTRKKLPVADTFNIWKVERQNSLMCRVPSQRVWLGTEHSSSTCRFHFISFRFLNIHDVETSGKQCHQQMKLFLEWHEWGRDFLFICVAFPIVHNVKVATAHHTFEMMWCKGSHSTSHFWTFPSKCCLEWEAWEAEASTWHGGSFHVYSAPSRCPQLSTSCFCPEMGLMNHSHFSTFLSGSLCPCHY